MRIGQKTTIDDYFKKEYGAMLASGVVTQKDYDEGVKRIKFFFNQHDGEIYEYFESTQYVDSRGLCSVDASGTLLAKFAAITTPTK